MRYLTAGLLCLWMLAVPFPAAVAAPAGISITSPQPGEALQGVVNIGGNTAVEGFQSAEISFAYSNNPTDTWFLIQSSAAPVAAGGVLAAWDTTTLTDGSYTLRLRVTLQDGSQLTADVPGLRVRNYTPVETSTPSATPLPATPGGQATRSPVATVQAATPTPLPPNPVEITSEEIVGSLAKGILAVLGMFLAGGLYALARSWSNRT